MPPASRSCIPHIFNNINESLPLLITHLFCPYGHCGANEGRFWVPFTEELAASRRVKAVAAFGRPRWCPNGAARQASPPPAATDRSPDAAGRPRAGSQRRRLLSAWATAGAAAGLLSDAGAPLSAVSLVSPGTAFWRVCSLV